MLPVCFHDEGGHGFGAKRWVASYYWGERGRVVVLEEGAIAQTYILVSLSHILLGPHALDQRRPLFCRGRRGEHEEQGSNRWQPL